MSEGGGLTVLDGTAVRAIDPAISDSDTPLSGAHLLGLADSLASSALLGLSLPQSLKSSALNRLHLDDAIAFHQSLLDPPQAASFLRQYLSAIADELNDDPLVVSILDGNALRLFLEDEDDFAMLAENLFTDLDVEDKGKISRREIRNALVHMGVEMGVPPFSEFPLLNDIIKKHGADEGGELGQAQFAQLLQPILQELADTLSVKRILVIQNLKIINGSKLRKLLADEKKLDDVVESILREEHNGVDAQQSTQLIRGFLEKKGRELGLPPLEANEAVVLLYDAVFAEIDNKKSGELEKAEFAVLVKEILQKFAEQLEANPIFHDLEN
ncbi:uncharacterized protein LOC131152650 [Malania oleifera]|uniref:uncharacterized protein LOC131152650 n=1 Tax=Malania oleifera TaxID=397392 RepID=UPI0025AE2D58|nr:uncharacterized protein LOC131152650 [Malania oleifera]